MRPGAGDLQISSSGFFNWSSGWPRSTKLPGLAGKISTMPAVSLAKSIRCEATTTPGARKEYGNGTTASKTISKPARPAVTPTARVAHAVQSRAGGKIFDEPDHRHDRPRNQADDRHDDADDQKPVGDDQQNAAENDHAINAAGDAENRQPAGFAPRAGRAFGIFDAEQTSLGPDAAVASPRAGSGSESPAGRTKCSNRQTASAG